MRQSAANSSPGGNSLLSGNLTGNFKKFGGLFAGSRVQLGCNFKPLRGNSLCKGTGNCCPLNREFFRQNREYVGAIGGSCLKDPGPP
jgi:hypothetical protein